jgi:Enoyl-CoA hydratase/isomerase
MHPDFAEGVRALLVDKDRSPRWTPATLGGVSQAYVEEHIASPSHGPQALADLA